MWSLLGFNPPGGFGAFGTRGQRGACSRCTVVSIRRADLGLSERISSGVATSGSTVSIRRADLGLSEHYAFFMEQFRQESFNPPGGFGAFGTHVAHAGSAQHPRVSIRRADLGLSERVGGWASAHPLKSSFNPPGGFGAFGTALEAAYGAQAVLFQSAGRIWGFRNAQHRRAHERAVMVSIRRADLGLSEPPLHHVASPFAGGFNPPGGFGAFGTGVFRCGVVSASVSIRRADLGLSELGMRKSEGEFFSVSIRRADLGLSEQSCQRGQLGLRASFNPPGGFGAFGTDGTGGCFVAVQSGFNPPGGFGAFGTCVDRRAA